MPQFLKKHNSPRHKAISYQFLFKDGARSMVNKVSNDTMRIESYNAFKLEDLTSYTLYIEARSRICELLTIEDIIVRDVTKVIQTTESVENIFKERYLEFILSIQAIIILYTLEYLMFTKYMLLQLYEPGVGSNLCSLVLKYI